MINEKNYISETQDLISFYKDKKSHSVKKYILTCHKYINELRNIDAIEAFTELEYEIAFKQVLGLVEETFRPDYFNSVFKGNFGKLVHWLDDEFIIYMLGVGSQLKKPLKWKLLIELQLKYSVMRIRWLCENGFECDFESYSIKNVPLSELFKYKL